MVLLDALSAKHSQVVRAVEVLHSGIVFFAQQTVNALLVLEVDVAQNAVAFHDLVQNVKVKGKLVDAFNLLHQLATDWAAHSEVVVQAVQTLRAERVAAVDQDTWNALAHVELFSAIVAEIEAPALVVALDELLRCIFAFLLFLLLLLDDPLLPERFVVRGFRRFLGKPVGPAFSSRLRQWGRLHCLLTI